MSTNSAQFSTHDEPVWRDRANFIINAPLSEEGRFEQLWTRQLNETQFEVCCIPFFLYDVALGDTVETVARGDLQYVLSRVRHRSGRFVFRAFFERRQYRYRESTVAALEQLGALTEWSSPSLLAIDAEGPAVRAVADTLHGFEQGEQLVYETGKMS